MAQTGAIYTSDDIREDLQCPVCLKIPRTTPIYQCESGHIHCKSCHPKLTNCPVCRSVVGSTRNLTAEKMIARLPTKCFFSENGCSAPAKPLDEQSKHEKNCTYRTVNCFVTNCNQPIPMKALIEHIMKSHTDLKFNDLETSRGSRQSFNSELFGESFNLNQKFTTFIDSRNFYAYKFKGFQFFVEFVMKNGCLTFYIKMIGSEQEAKSIKYFIEANSIDKPEMVVSSTGNVAVIDAEPNFPIMVINESQLKQMLNKDGKVNYKLKFWTRLDDEAFIRHFMDVCTSGIFPKDPVVLKDINLNYKINGRTALMVACERGNFKVAAFLLQLSGIDKSIKVDVFAQDNFGKSAFYIACENGSHAIVDLILRLYDFHHPDRKKLKDPQNVTKSTPLQIACQKRHLKVVEILLQNLDITDINAKDNKGDSAFDIACKLKCEATLNLLIRSAEMAKIVLDVKSGYDLWPEKFDFLSKFEKICLERDNIKILELFGSRTDGIDFKASNKNKETAFILACKYENIVGAAYLLKVAQDNPESFDIFSEDFEKRTGLFYACENGCYEIVRMVLKLCKSSPKSELNKCDLLNVNPLLTACENDRVNTVRILIEFSDVIDFNFKDGLGRTAFHYACIERNGEICDMLVESAKKTKIDLESKDKSNMSGYDCWPEKFQIKNKRQRVE